MKTPTIGRIVRYVDSKGKEYAAIIAAVADESVDLVIFQSWPTDEPAKVIMKVKASDPLTSGGEGGIAPQSNKWYWPPVV